MRRRLRKFGVLNNDLGLAWVGASSLLFHALQEGRKKCLAFLRMKNGVGGTDVGLDLENGQWPEAETPSERLLEDWAERVKAMKPGDYVAARGGEKEEGQWILAQYSRWNTDHELFEVTDVDEEEQGREPLRLKMRDLVPLPKDGSSPYLEGTTVLAVYPSTTTFYRARVVQQPHYSSGELAKRREEKEELVVLSCPSFPSTCFFA